MNRPLTTDETVKMEVTDAVETFMRAFNGGDVAAVVDLYAEDCIVAAPGADPIVGRSGLTAFWERMIREAGMSEVAHTILDVTPVGRDVATEVTRFAATIGGVRHAGAYLVQWKRVDGAWRLHRDVFNAAPAA